MVKVMVLFGEDSPLKVHHGEGDVAFWRGLTSDKSIMVKVMVLFEDDSPLISPSW
jgi:hypothetical protein